ncbi:MAG: hypothetical protein WAO35_01890 [Terriglobia bacterium]
MPRFHAFLLALLASVSAPGPARAQTASVSIPAWVEVGGCGPAPKFEATFNGKPAPVTSQLGPGSDQIVLLVLDVTGELSLVDAAKQALMAEISKLPSNAWVGLLRDQDGLHVLADPGPNRQPLLDAIRDLATLGKPGVFETVTPALSLADSIMRKSPVRVSVLYITDSNIYSYREDYTNPVINGSDPHDLSRVFPDALIQDKISKLVGEASALEAPLFVVHINYRRDTLNASYENGLLTLAEATGGKAQMCRSVGEIPDVIAAAFTRISSAWRLTLEVPANFHNNAQIRLSAPCGGEEVRLSWRTHLRPKEG